MPFELRLERKDQPDETGVVGPVLFTPPINSDYWEYRVIVSEVQAVVGFPKMDTTGIGFAFEENWNTNLPCSISAAVIYDHIKRNKRDKSITKARCLEAIQLIQKAVAEDHPEMFHPERHGARGAVLT